MFAKTLVPFFAILASSAWATKTDLAGCTLTIVPLLTEIVTTTVNGVASSYGDYAETTFQWDGTEQCQLLDCGGGRAPPKTDAPGCPGYTGTDTIPSLPFPTASLTLNQAAATSAAAPAGATATPALAATSSLPSGSSTTSNASSTGTVAASASATTSGGGSASAASALNPTTPSNNARQLRGRWDDALVGLTAIAAAAALPFA